MGRGLVRLCRFAAELGGLRIAASGHDDDGGGWPEARQAEALRMATKEEALRRRLSDARLVRVEL